MDNNILEMLLKMLSNGSNQSNGEPFNPSNNIYPQNNFTGQAQAQDSFRNQNNILPLLLSLLSKNPSSNIFASSKKEENKKAEVSSASNDEILL